MATTKDKTATVEPVEAERIEGEQAFDLPGVTPPEEGALMPFATPAMSQWRRRLREDELLRYIADQVSGRMADDDPAAIMEMLSGIARATTFEEAIGGGETTQGATLLDVTLAVYGIKFLKSREPKGCPYFCMLDAKRTDTGEAVLVSVGGWKVVGTMGWAHYASRDLPEDSPWLVAKGTPGAIEQQTFPFLFKIRKEETSSGYTVNVLALPHQ
jgi:hypothetical protein